MFNKLFMVLFISFIFFSCSEETNQALETWETCSYIQGSYIKGLQLKCGEEIRKDHYNSIKTTFDEKGEHYYCKEKYKNYYGEVNFPTKSGKYHIPKIDWTKKEYTTSTCDELTPYIGTKLEEEVDLYI